MSKHMATVGRKNNPLTGKNIWHLPDAFIGVYWTGGPLP